LTPFTSHLYSADMDPRPGLNINELVARSGFDRRTIVYYIQQGILPKVGRRGPRTRYPEECLTRLLFVRGLKDMQERGRLPGVTLADMAYALAVLKPEKVQELVDRSMPEPEIESLFLARPAAPVAYGRPAPGPPPVAWRQPPAPPTSQAPAPASTPATVPWPAPGAVVATMGQGPLPSPAGASPPPLAPMTATGGPAAPAPPVPAPRRSLLGAAPADKRSYGLADAAIRQRLGVTQPPAPMAPAAPPAPPDPADAPAGGRPASAAAMLAPPQAAAAGDPAGPGEDLGELLRQLELRAGSGRNRPPGAAEQWTEIPVTSRVYLSVRGLGEADAPVADAIARALKRALRSR
jgi:DNA-binding transcriptional MerR regulator